METRIRRDSTSIRYLGAVTVGIVASAFIAAPLLERRNSLGFLVLLAGPVLSVVAYGLLRRSAGDLLQPQSAGRRLALAGAAFVIGPVLAAVGATICVRFSDLNPLDHGAWILMATFIGFIASTIVSVAIAASAMFK